VEIALRLKKLGNDMCDVLAGRTTHPVSFCVGGINRVPDKKELRKLRDNISARMNDVKQTVELFKTLELPDFTRETEFVSLKGEEDYPWIGGDLISTEGVVKNENDYLGMTNEYVVDFSTSKFTKLSRKSFAVGALARINNNYKFLKAKDVAEEFGLKPVNHNPFMNNIAQLVEVAHVMIESQEMIDELLDNSLDDICAEYDLKEGEGIGAVEVPRGILYHHYRVNKKGLIEKANCIIPTTQNNANIHYDMADLVEHEVNKGKTDSEVKKLCEMLVRAYDPCISCSVH
jgi:coenzyme F420-reducing hydrogenase alpha subunit